MGGKSRKKPEVGPQPAKYSGQITLRLPPKQHAQLAFIADTLGLDINGLLRLIIATRIAHYQQEAETLLEEMRDRKGLFEIWREANPEKPAREYWDYWWSYQAGKKQKEALPLLAGFDFDKAQTLLAARAAQEAEGTAPQE